MPPISRFRLCAPSTSWGKFFDILLLSNIWGIGLLLAPIILICGVPASIAMVFMLLSLVGLKGILIALCILSSIGLILALPLSKLPQNRFITIHHWAWLLALLSPIILMICHALSAIFLESCVWF